MLKPIGSIIYSAIIIFTTLIDVNGQNPPAPVIDKCWDYQSERLSTYEMASDNEGNLYFSTSDGSIIALDKSGEIFWQTEIGKSIISKIIYDNQRLFFTVASDENPNEVTAFSISSLTGITNWKKDLEQKNSANYSTEISFAGNNLIVSSNAGNFAIINAQSGEIVGKVEEASPVVSNTIVTNGEVTYLSGDKKLQSFNFQSKKIVTIATLGETFRQIFRIDESQIILSSSTGRIIKLDTKSGKTIWKNRIGGGVNSLSIHQNDLIISSVDNYIYAASSVNGKIKWRKRLENRNSSVIEKKSKLVFASIINEDKTVVLWQKDGRIVNQIKLPASAYFTNTPLAIEEKILLLHSGGISLYSLDGCQKLKKADQKSAFVKK